MKKNLRGGQGCVLQGTIRSFGPEHGKPPFAGAGLVQFLL